MSRVARIVALAVISGAPLGVAFVIPRTAGAQAQEDRIEWTIAEALRITLQVDRMLADIEPLHSGGASAPPQSAQRTIADFAAEHPTQASCARMVEEVEAWNAWAEREWLWQFSLVGLADKRAAHNARVAAGSVLALSSVAARAMDLAIDEADRQPALRRDEATERNLATALHAREVVLPLRAARAALVVASLAPESADRATLARAALGLARQAAGASVWADTEKALVAAHARALLGQSAEAAELFASADRAVAAGDLPATFAAEVRLEALLGGAQSRPAPDRLAAQRDLDAVLSRDPARAWIASSVHRSLLAADTSMKLARAYGAEASEQLRRDQSISIALARYAGATRAQDPAISRDGAMSLVLDHLGGLLPARESYRNLHPVAAIARARVLASDPQSLHRAIAILDETVARPPAELGSMAPQALLELAAACARSEDPLLLRRGVEQFLAFADRFAIDERAGRAVALACAAADRLLRTEPQIAQDELSTLRRIELSLLTLRRAHTFAGEVPQRDAWRLALARLLVWKIENTSVAQSDVLAMVREAVAIASSIQEPALVAQAAVERSAAWNAAVVAIGDEPAQASDVGIRLLAAVEDARAEQAISQSASPGIDGRLTAYQSRALLSLGRAAEALEVISPVLKRENTVADTRTLIDALLIALQAQIRVAAPIERTLETALRLEEIRPTAARTLIERQAASIWSDIQPAIRGFATASGADARLGPAELLTLFLGERLEGAIEGESAGEVAARRVAWALLLSGRSQEAEARFLRLVEARPGVLEYRRGAAESRLALGADQEAFARFREIVTAADADTSTDVWLAWTRMMEILARHNDGGARSAEIRREIARLRTLESALEQPECLARLREIEDALPAP